MPEVGKPAKVVIVNIYAGKVSCKTIEWVSQRQHSCWSGTATAATAAVGVALLSERSALHPHGWAVSKHAKEWPASAAWRRLQLVRVLGWASQSLRMQAAALGNNTCYWTLPSAHPVCAPMPCLFALQSILQGIDAPLVPNTAIAKALGADAAKTTTEKAAASSAKPADNKSGRKLLQRSGSAGGGSRNDRAGNWSAMNTQASIRAAASGRAPASYATAAGRTNANNAGRRCVNCVAW